MWQKSLKSIYKKYNYLSQYQSNKPQQTNKINNLINSAHIQILMSQTQQISHLVQGLKSQKCQRKGCLSANRGQLELVWFGKQYQAKQMTCSSCYMLNDEAIKKSIPASFNVLPLLKFNDKLLEEYRTYEERKKSQNWHPLIIKQKRTQISNQLVTFEAKLVASLANLQLALQNFLKKLQQNNKQIFSHQTLNQIIDMKAKNSFEGLLQKIECLVKQLNYCELTKNYEFERIEMRNKKIEKEKEKISEVVEKVNRVLGGLLEEIKRRNETIAKI